MGMVDLVPKHYHTLSCLRQVSIRLALIRNAPTASTQHCTGIRELIVHKAKVFVWRMIYFLSNSKWPRGQNSLRKWNSKLIAKICVRNLLLCFLRWNRHAQSLTHWGRVTHICVSKLTIIGSDNGLSPGRRQAIIWTNAGLLLIGPLGTNFSEILSEIRSFSFKKTHLKMSSAKWRLSRLDLNVWTTIHSTSLYPFCFSCKIRLYQWRYVGYLEI